MLSTVIQGEPIPVSDQGVWVEVAQSGYNAPLGNDNNIYIRQRNSR